MKTWQIRGQALRLKSPTIMGILNITPDSFHDGGQYDSVETAVRHALELQAQGAHILDIGAQSTRPGHTVLQAETELARLEPVLKALAGKLHIPISVDTYYPAVAEKCLSWGAKIINDVSGVFQGEMADVLKKSGAGYVIMHTGFRDLASFGEKMQGKSMQAENEAVPIETQVSFFFREVIRQYREAGVDPASLCLDTGIGFGKNRAQNEALITYKLPEDLRRYPLLIGVSHKRIVRELYGEDTLGGTIRANKDAVLCGTDILRVHDVEAHSRAFRML